jgi:cytoskeleton protein RodZ
VPEPKPATETKPAPEVAALPEPKPAPEAATGNSRITLRAITHCYIQVRDNDSDQLLITRLLKKGDSYNVPNRTGLSLITANAGALEILVDGTAVPSIGPIGAIRRNVLLEAEKLIDGSAIIE